MPRDEGLPPAFIILRDYLKENFRAKSAAGGRECVIRCPFCGDSKDPKSAHLYIGFNRKKNRISYNCFKCNTSGDIGIAFFRTLGIYDSSLIQMVLEFNQSNGGVIYADIHKGYKNRFNSVSQDCIIPVNDSPEYLKKMDYIGRRIGRPITFQDVTDYKIVLNLLDFLSANGITTYSRHMNIMEQLSFGFLGFLSADSTHVTLRRLIPENKVHESLTKRYNNYTIHENGTQVYCIREAINPYLPNIVCIAEGAFDILSLHYNYFYAMPNKIMFAACGKGVQGVLNYLIYSKGLSLFNTTFHIFIDNDITPMDFNNYRQTLMRLGVPFYFHKNTFPKEKDYGVPSSNIRDYLIR